MDTGTCRPFCLATPQYAMVGATEATLQDDGIRYYKNADFNLGWPTYRRVGMTQAAYK